MFLTYDDDFASEGPHVWSVNKAAWNEDSLGPQWEDTKWKPKTTVLESVSVGQFALVKRLAIKDGSPCPLSEDDDNAKVRKIE